MFKIGFKCARCNRVRLHLKEGFCKKRNTIIKKREVFFDAVLKPETESQKGEHRRCVVF